MTTAAEYAALAEASANEAGTHAISVQNKVAVAESSANLATTHANTVGASVTGAAASSSTATLQAIAAENYRDLAQLWANADPNVVVEGTAFSARHQALSTIATLAAMQATLDTHTNAYTSNKSTTDAALAYLAYRLDTGLLTFDSSSLDTDISNLSGSVNSALANKLNIALYNSDSLGLADFAASNKVSLDNKIIDYLDDAGQIALQAMLAGAENTTKLSYAGVVVDPSTGVISNNAGSAVATEYGVRMATAETNLDGQGKYTVQVQQQLTDDIATARQELETSIATNGSSIGAINAKFSVKLNSGNHVAGFGLTSTAYNDVTDSGFSEFIVAADSFRVGGASSTTAPFRVITGAGVCVSPTGVETGNTAQAACATAGGTWLAPGTWMTDTYMKSANILGMLTIGSPVATSISNAQAAAEAASDSSGSAATAQANAISTAATAAQTKADLAETTAKAYADGIVTAEEARAIADATAKANAAQAAAQSASDASGSAAAAQTAAEATAAAALLAFQNTVYYAGTTQINGANIRAGTISLLPQDVGVGIANTASTNRLVIDSTSVRVIDSSNVVRVKLGLL